MSLIVDSGTIPTSIDETETWNLNENKNKIRNYQKYKIEECYHEITSWCKISKQM